MDKNRIYGVSAGRAGNLPRSPYPSKVQSVDSATVHGKRLCLPQEICSVSLRRLRLSKGGLTAGQKSAEGIVGDRKSTRLNSSHLVISYAVFCLKKKTQQRTRLIHQHQRHSVTRHDHHLPHR